MLKIKNKWIIKGLKLLGILFLCLNIIAFFHTYKFTHFSSANIEKSKDGFKLSRIEKLKTILFGINNPRPINEKTPTQKYETIILDGKKKTECWAVKTDSIAKGTIVVCHGYSGSKSGMIGKSDEFLKMGYNTLLLDFMGSGGSGGNITTIGYYEAEQVQMAFNYLKNKGVNNIVLMGTSMGAVAIMKAIQDYQLTPCAIILECPFGSMLKTTKARFTEMKVPSFPMANLLVFWGGVQNNFWAYGHSPINYARNINCKTLLLYGEKDTKVSKQEIDDIYTNLKGQKTLGSYPLAGHEDYLNEYKNEWVIDVKFFLK